jgi:hypothetical protein
LVGARAFDRAAENPDELLAIVIASRQTVKATNRAAAAGRTKRDSVTEEIASLQSSIVNSSDPWRH